MLSEDIIKDAISSSPWDLGNNVLYDLCKHYPKHGNHQEIIAKIWLIGRSYAAAIERRKSKNVIADENFYLDKVAPEILKSNIDKLFDELRKFKEINKSSLPTILKTHKELTDLLSRISGLDKRSLASKYLHFHFPDLYFIYDSRAVRALSKLKNYTGRAGSLRHPADNEYRKLFEKCLTLRISINKEYKHLLSPRQIDNILLSIA